MPLKIANNAVSRLSASLSAASTTLGVMPGDGAKFPALAAGDWFPLTIVKTDGTLEIVKATARTIDTFTVVRAQEGTSATDFSAGDRVELRLTAATLDAKLDQVKTEVATNAATSKATPVDADEIPMVDSAASNGLKKLTWANLKAGIFAAWGALINGGTGKDAPVDADAIAIMDSAASNATKKLLLSKLKAFVITFTSANVASAATLDLTGQIGKTVHITGTTAITALTMAAGQVIDLIFDGVLTLTHNATSNNLPGAADITTAAGDRARYFYDGTTVYCMQYQRVDGKAVVETPQASAQTVRQTVLSGPVDSNGLSSFGGSTGSTTVTASGALTATAAGGVANRTGSITNPSWTGLSTNGTMYLYLEIAANGAVTTGSTALAPNYIWGNAYSTANGQHSFSIQEMTMKVGNGSAASQVYRVFVGEVTVAGGVVSAITWYALMGRYESALQTITAGTPASFAHNIGAKIKQKPLVVLVNQTADAGYSAGHELVGGFELNTASNAYGMAVTVDSSNTIRTTPGAGGVAVPNYNTGGGSVLVLANWRQKVIVNRGW